VISVPFFLLPTLYPINPQTRPSWPPQCFSLKKTPPMLSPSRPWFPPTHFLSHSEPFGNKCPKSPLLLTPVNTFARPIPLVPLFMSLSQWVATSPHQLNPFSPFFHSYPTYLEGFMKSKYPLFLIPNALPLPANCSFPDIHYITHSPFPPLPYIFCMTFPINLP